MRAVWPLLLASCYSAAPPQGIPCDPVSPACPRGQQCVSGPTGHVCSQRGEELIDAPNDPDAAIDAPVPPDGAMPITKTYNATVAECSDPMFPSPTTCRQLNGPTQMVIDTKDSTTNGSWNAYIRFDTDSALAGKTITKVTLRVHSTTDGKAPGSDTGSVFRVGAFTRASLDTSIPAIMGNALAGSQGAVQQNMPITWTLPNTLVAANAAVYLAIVPNDDDGVNYYNTDGAMPPRLIIDAQ